MRNYVRLHGWEYLLTVLIAIGMHLNTFSAFMVKDSYMTNYALVAIVTAVVMALMYVIGYSKRNSIIGAAGMGVALIVWIIYLRAKDLLDLSEGADETIPAFWTIVTFGTALIYVLTRSRKILYAAAPVGLLFCGAFRFLEYPVSTPGLFLLVAALLLQILFLTYKDSLLSAQYGSFKISHFILQSIAIVTVIVMLSSGVFYGIVKPLEPPTQDLKLITKMMQFDILELLGVSSTQEVRQPDDSDQDNNDDSKKEEEKQEEDQEEDRDDEQNRESEEDISASTISYDEEKTPPYWVIPLVLIVLGSPFAVKYVLRARRRRRLNGLSPSGQAAFIYDFFLDRFRKLGFGKAESATIREYAEQQSGFLESFTAEDGTTFEEITDLYDRQLYSRVPVTPEEASRFIAIYNSFYKNARAFTGSWKYLRKFWFI